MTLREMCESIGIDSDPQGCAFVIAGTLRTAVQGDYSTFEGECASLVKASEFYDIREPSGIRKWLDDLGAAADHDLPKEFWLGMADSDKKRFRERWREYEAKKFMEAAERIDRLIRLDAPPVVTAQLLVHVMLPKLFKVVGIEACTEQIVRWMAERLCMYTGVCAVCKKVPATDASLDACAKCAKEINDMCADADEE